MHVDEFIDDPFNEEKYAQWVLFHFRLSAVMQNQFREFMKDKKLFCEYEGRTYSVIGASRMGDIWLCKDFEATHGYDLRVDIEKCTNWAPDCGEAISEPKPKPKKIANNGSYLDMSKVFKDFNPNAGSNGLPGTVFEYPKKKRKKNKHNGGLK